MNIEFTVWFSLALHYSVADGEAIQKNEYSFSIDPDGI